LDVGEIKYSLHTLLVCVDAFEIMLNLTTTHEFYPFFTKTNSENNNNGN